MNALHVTTLRGTIAHVERTFGEARELYPEQTLILEHLEHAHRHLQQVFYELDAPGCACSVHYLHSLMIAERMNRASQVDGHLI